MDIIPITPIYGGGHVEHIHPVNDKDRGTIHGDSDRDKAHRHVKDASDPDSGEDGQRQDEDAEETTVEKTEYEWLDSDAEKAEDSDGGEHHILDFRA